MPDVAALTASAAAVAAPPGTKALVAPAPSGGSQVEIKPAERIPASEPAAPGGRLVWAVIPCFNRPADLALVLEDLTGLDMGVTHAGNGRAADMRLKVVVVDNASATPLSAMKVPAGLDVTFLRLRENTGGAGGYNAGMAYALSQGRQSGSPAEFVWLVDSDVRIERGALRGLVDALDARPDAVAAGSAIADMQDGWVFEVGGRVEKLWGQFGPRYGGERLPRHPVVECTYTAACSALVRAEAIEATGLFPEVFLNGDDVEWFIRMAAVTGKKVLATTESVVRHPFFGRYSTMPRYYMSRNCYGPLDALGCGWRVRLFRALRDVPRAVAQIMVGRDDLAELHFKGLEHAARRLSGAAPAGTIEFERARAFETLAETVGPLVRESDEREVYVHKRVVLPVAKADELQRQLGKLGLRTGQIQRGFFNIEHEWMFKGFMGGLWRMLVAGPTADIAVIHARGRPMAWCRGRVQILMSQDGYVVRTLDRRAYVGRAWKGLWRGIGLALRVAGRKKAAGNTLPRVEDVAGKLAGMTG